MADDNKDISKELSDLFNEKDASGKVEAIREMFNPKNIKMKSDVNPAFNESFKFAKLNILAKYLGTPILSEFTEEDLLHRVSNGRRGRAEAVEVSRTEPETQRSGGFLSRMFGRS